MPKPWSSHFFTLIETFVFLTLVSCHMDGFRPALHTGTIYRCPTTHVAQSIICARLTCKPVATCLWCATPRSTVRSTSLLRRPFIFCESCYFDLYLVTVVLHTALAILTSFQCFTNATLRLSIPSAYAAQDVYYFSRLADIAILLAL